MAVTKEHVHPAAAFVIVPTGTGVVDAAVRMPGPITTDDLGGRSFRDLARLDRRRGDRIKLITGDLLHSAKGHGAPFDEVAVAPTVPAGFGCRIYRVPVISRATCESER